MNLWKFIVISHIACSQPLWAQVYIPNCPKEISKIEHIQTSENDWETISDIPHNFLSGISFYSGHPKEGASLKPHVTNKNTSKWRFSPKNTIYIVCQYNQTGIKLTQPLPKKTVQCTVKYNEYIKGDNGFIPQKINCSK